jgi:hypothetical protein
MTDLIIRALLRLYPRAWRDRYGDELAGLIFQASEQPRPSLRLTADVAAEGIRERLRAVGVLGTDLTHRDRTQSGVMVVMWSWMLFCLGGIGFEKAAEHWRPAVSGTNAQLPEIAFAAFFSAAVIGSGLVVAGVAVGGRTLVAYLQAGGWPQIRRPIYRAGIVTALTMIALVAVAIWAHHLTSAQRNGQDDSYSAAVVGWAVLFAACLFSWAGAAAATIRHLSFSVRLMRLESWIAAVVAAAMAAMTIATAVWWATIADTTPWFFAGTPPHTPGAVAPSNLIIPAALMAIATVLGAVGAVRSLRNSRLCA